MPSLIKKNLLYFLVLNKRSLQDEVFNFHLLLKEFQ